MLTKRQDKIINEEDNRVNQEELSREEQEKLAIENGDKGIFNSNKDKRIYIKHLKNQIKINRDNVKQNVLFFLLDPIVVILGIGGSYLGYTIYQSIFKPEVNILLMLLGHIGAPVLFLGGFPLILYGLSRIIGEDGWAIAKFLKENHKIKKMIKSLEKSTIKVNSKKKTDDNPVNNEIVEDSVEKEKTNPIKQSVRKISKEFEDLKNKILLVQDEKTKVRYSGELLEIVNYYGEVSPTMEIESNTLSVHKNILDRIVSLSFRVDETLKKEKKDEQESSEFNRMLDEVNKLSTKGSRK